MLLLLFGHGGGGVTFNFTKYFLDGTGIPRPSQMLRSQILIQQDFVSINGRNTRDISAKKEQFILSYEYLSQTEIDLLKTLVEQNVAVSFEVDDGQLQIEETSVWPVLQQREYKTRGGDYIESTQLVLTEVGG